MLRLAAAGFPNRIDEVKDINSFLDFNILFNHDLDGIGKNKLKYSLANNEKWRICNHKSLR